ncbi:hypothetical protein [Hyphobacterium sp.]|uniref:hypothetical protein n=1 Tax=Hyphobacterium sp. TaxID=2004662 RepID=UPI003BABB8D9
MAIELIALAFWQSAATSAESCTALANVAPPRSGELFLYATDINGEDMGMVMGVQIVTSTGLATSFRQGAGLTADSIEMSNGTPVRSYAGAAFPRSAGSGNRRREWSYSPSPDEVLARLGPGETEEIFISERSAGAGERYTATLAFDRCDTLDVDGDPVPANVYSIAREIDRETEVREIWLSSETGWWLMEHQPAQSMTTRLIGMGGE